MSFPGDTSGKEHLPMQEMQVRSLGWKDPLGDSMAAHSSSLAWRIPWSRILVGYSPWGCKESDMTEEERECLMVRVIQCVTF